MAKICSYHINYFILQELVEHFCVPAEETVNQWKTLRWSLQGMRTTADKSMMWIKEDLATSYLHMFKGATVDLLPTFTFGEFLSGHRPATQGKQMYNAVWKSSCIILSNQIAELASNSMHKWM